MAHDNIVNARLVNFDAPGDSRLVVKVQGGHVSISAAVADEIRAQIEAWVADLAASGEAPVVPTPTPIPVTGDPSVDLFATTVHPVLITNCASCHGVNQLPLHSVANPTESHNTVIQSALVDLLNPANSRLATKIDSGHEGINVSVANELRAQITAWVQGGGGAGVEPVVLEPTYKSISALILIPKCATCHSPTGTRRSEDYSTYAGTVATIGEGFWDEIQTDSMPTGRGSSPLSAEEKAVIRAWLDAGAPNN
jgi:cytochrome c553